MQYRHAGRTYIQGTVGSLLGLSGEKYIHPAEEEYMEFRPVLVREEKRRVWVGNRYAIRMCKVYDAGACVHPQPYDGMEQLEDSKSRKKRSRWEMDMVIHDMMAYLGAEGPATGNDIALRTKETRATIRGILVKRPDIFEVAGTRKTPGAPGPPANLYDLRENDEAE